MPLAAHQHMSGPDRERRAGHGQTKKYILQRHILREDEALRARPPLMKQDDDNEEKRCRRFNAGLPRGPAAWHAGLHLGINTFVQNEELPEAGKSFILQHNMSPCTIAAHDVGARRSQLIS